MHLNPSYPTTFHSLPLKPTMHNHPLNSEVEARMSMSSRTTPTARNNQNTFVHKLGMLISDPKHADLIYWNPDGKSFTVKNIEEFSKSVLPLHFKHNNFASFIRQLNMYGFHKINRSPRGHRSDPSYQTWEFSHPKFLRDNLELIRDIRRTATEPDLTIKPTSMGSDTSMQISLMHSQQTEILSRLQSVTSELAQVRRELAESNRVLGVQQQVIQKITSQLHQQQNLTMPHSPSLSDTNSTHGMENMLFANDPAQPTIFVTPPDAQNGGAAAAGQGYDRSNRMHNACSPYMNINANEGNNSFLVNNMPNNMQNTLNHNLNGYNQAQVTLQSNNRPMLTINTMNLQSHGHLSPSLLPVHGSEASASDDEFARASPRSPVSPFHLHHQHSTGYHNQHQLNASPVDPSNHNASLLFKNSPS